MAGQTIDAVTYWILWAGVAWAIISMVKQFVLELFNLRPRERLIVGRRTLLFYCAQNGKTAPVSGEKTPLWRHLWNSKHTALPVDGQN